MEAVSELKNLGLGDYYYRKPVVKHVYEFAVLFATILFVYGAWKGWKLGDLILMASCTVVGSLLVMVGRYLPKLLLAPWRSWMIFGALLGSVMSIVILSLLWFVMVTPIALFLKIVGIKVMDMGFRSQQPSYWLKRDIKKDDFKLLERQF